MPVVGNHDCGPDGPLLYRRMFRTPSDGLGQNWYSLRFQNADLIILDLYPERGSNDENINIIEDDYLEKRLAKSKKQWKFIFMHHPVYSTGGHGGDNLPLVLKRWLPVFEKHSVNAVMSGHVHMYEVSKPILKHKMIPEVKEIKIDDKNSSYAKVEDGVIYYNTAGVNGATPARRERQNFTLDRPFGIGDENYKDKKSSEKLPLVNIVSVSEKQYIMRTYFFMDYKSPATGILHKRGEIKHSYIISK